MVDVVDGAGVGMDGDGDGGGAGVEGHSSLSANGHQEWQLQDPAERPETSPIDVGESASQRGSPRAEEDAAVRVGDTEDGDIEEEGRDAFHFPAGFAAGFLPDLEDVDEAEGLPGGEGEEQEGENDEAGAAGAGGEDETHNSSGVLGLSDESVSSKVKITRWLRKASLLMPEAGPMVLDSADDADDGGEGGGFGRGEIRQVGSRTVSNKSILSQRTISHRTLSSKTISRGSLMSAKSFSSKSVAASIISAVGGNRAPRPVMNSTTAGGPASEKVIEEYVMSQAAKEIDEKTLVTRKSEYGRFLTSRFLRATRLPAGMLDKMRDRTQNLLSQSRPASPSTCLLALFSKHWFLFCLACQATLCLYRGVNGVSAAVNNFSLHSIREFRLISSGLDPIQPLSLALLFDGCPIKIGSIMSEFYDESLGGPGIRLAFNETVTVNGWCVKFADGNEQDGHAYMIQGRAQTGEWETVGASRWTLVESVISEMADAPPPGGSCISVKPSWMWDAAIYVVPIVEGSLLLAAIIFARLRQETRGMYFVAGALSGPIPVEIVIAVLFIAFQDQDVGLLTFVLSRLIVRVITTAAVWWRKQYLLNVLAAGGLVFFLADVILQASGFGIASTVVPRLVWLDAAICVMPVIFHFLWSVSETVRVGLEMADSVDKYEEIWATILKEQLMDLETLQGLTASHDGFGQARQLNRLRIGTGQTNNPGMESTGELSNLTGGPPIMGGGARGSLVDNNQQGSFSSIVLKKQNGGSLPGVLDAESPVESLDQLFAQAAGCDNFVRSKVKKWAKESGGMLMVDDELMTWVDIEAKGLQNEVQWARCKKPERAIGKAFFAYGGKVSNLVDLCRQRIVFEDVASLGLCMVQILKDSETRVERVKNFMDPDFDACPRGGLRQIVVNLRLDDPFTRWLGIETHVCEVCLLLRPFAQCVSRLTESQRKSYILMRNSRPNQVSMVPIKSVQRLIGGGRVAPLPDRDAELGLVERTPSGQTERSGKLADDIRSLALREEVERMTQKKRNRAPSWQKRWSFVGTNSGGNRPSLHTASMPANPTTSHPTTMRHPTRKAMPAPIVQQQQQGSWRKSEARVREEYLWQEFFISSYLNTTMDVGAFLERRLQREVAAMKMASAASALYMSRPIAAAATTTWFKACLALVSAAFVLELAADTLIYNDLSKHKARCVRFSSIGASWGNSTSPWVEGGGSLIAGLMIRGCKYGRDGTFQAEGFDYSLLEDVVETFSNAEGERLTVCFQDVEALDGWYVDDAKTRQAALGRFQFEILGRKSQGGTLLYHYLQDDVEIKTPADIPADGWELVGTSGAVFASHAEWIMKDAAGSGPWMLYAPWMWAMSSLVKDCVLLIVPLICLYLAHIGMYRYVHLCISAMFGTMSVAYLAAGLGYLISGNSYSAYAPLSACILYGFSVVMVFYEFRIVLLVLILGIWTIATALVEVFVVLGHDKMSRLPFGGMLLVFSWVVIVFRRYRALVYAQRLVENDVKTYCGAWEKVLQGEEVQFWIDSITEIQRSVYERATWHRYVSSKYEQPDLRQCNRKDAIDDADNYSFGEKKEDEIVFRDLAKEQIQDTSALANLSLASEVSDIDEMEPSNKTATELVPLGAQKSHSSDGSFQTSSGRLLVPTLLKREASGGSNSGSLDSFQPVMSPTPQSTGLGQPTSPMSAHLLPRRKIPESGLSMGGANRADVPAVPEFKRTGTAEFDMNATVMRAGSGGLERFNSRGEIQRVTDDEALPGIVMIHATIDSSQVTSRRSQPALDQVLEDAHGEDMKGGAEDNSVTFVSGHSFGGGWEVQAMSPRGLVRAGAELCVSGERFGEGETQQVGQATPSTDEISQASNGGAVGRIWGDVTEEVASRLEQSKSDQPNFLGRKGLSTSPLPIRAHDRLVSEDVVSSVNSPTGSASIKSSPRRFLGGSRRGSAGSGGGADMSLIDADSPKNVHSGVSVTDILFGHGRTRKNVNTGRLQTLPQNGQLEWKCGDLSTSIGVVKRASSNSSVQRFMRSASLASASAEGRTRQDSVGSHGMSSDSVDGKATSKGIHSAILATSSLDDMPLRSNMPASTGRENLQSASMNYAQDLSAEDGGRASRTWPGRAKASTFDTVSASSGNNKGDVTPTDFAALTKQQQGTRLRQAISAQPAAAGLGGHDAAGSQNALQQEIDRAKSIDDLGTMISAMDPLEANNEVLKGKEGSVDWKSPIRSLDQLFAQAAGLDIILKAMVQRWAFASDGSFSLRGNKAFQKSGFVKWREASKNPAKARWIKWGKIKTPERAIEKAFRSYKGDVSKLLDLTRQTIVYDDLGTLYEGLKAICDDPDVVVERVKNRMDPSYDASVNSAGYRDVSLNIRIVNETTMGMGIETHVCEVQLLLKDFAVLKNDDGHARYVTWRNTRGE